MEIMISICFCGCRKNLIFIMAPPPDTPVGRGGGGATNVNFILRFTNYERFIMKKEIALF